MGNRQGKENRYGSKKKVFKKRKKKKVKVRRVRFIERDLYREAEYVTACSQSTSSEAFVYRGSTGTRRGERASLEQK